jgi:hypothetical protein
MTEIPTRNGAALVMYRLGGKDYPLISEPTCKTCFSPYRFHIESEVLAAVPAAVVVRRLVAQDAEVDLTPRNVLSHIEAHMPAKEVAYLRIAQRRATERGRTIEEGTDNLVNGLALAEAVVKRTWDRIAQGEIKPTVQDGLRAAQILETFEGADTGIDQDLFVEAFMVYFDAAESLMTTEQFAQFGRVLEANEVLSALVTRFEAQQEGRVVSGEVESGSQGNLDLTTEQD